LADAIGQRAQQFAVNVDGASAHPGDDSGVLWFGALQARQDHILPRAQNIPEDPEDFHVHRFGLCAFKNGIRYAVEPTMDFRQGKDTGGCGGRWRCRADLGNQATRSQKNCGQ
jgi:hypothetical protein